MVNRFNLLAVMFLSLFCISSHANFYQKCTRLLTKSADPLSAIQFTALPPKQLEKFLLIKLKKIRQKIWHIANNKASASFGNTIRPLDETTYLYSVARNILEHYKELVRTPEIEQMMLRMIKAHKKYYDDVILFNDKLAKKVKTLHKNRRKLKLDDQQIALVEKYFRDFEKQGSYLSKSKKKLVSQYDEELKNLYEKFSSNLVKAQEETVLEATLEEKELMGLPESTVKEAATRAQERGSKHKYLFASDDLAVIEYTSFNPNLRKEAYLLSGTIANQGKYSNVQIVKRIIELRSLQARAMGYNSHAARILKDKMVQNESDTLKFLSELREKLIPKANAELKDLQQFVENRFGIKEFAPWDLEFLKNIQKSVEFMDTPVSGISDYFEFSRCQEAVFNLIHRLYNVSFTKVVVPTHHPSVQTFRVKDISSGEDLGLLYLDLFQRTHKKYPGAYQGDFKPQVVIDGTNVRPHVIVMTNITAPTPGEPHLLAPAEMKTFMHEMGHAMHGLFTDVRYGGLGQNSVMWDFIEFPSKFMENWLMQPDFLKSFAVHHKTREPISDELIAHFSRLKNYGMATDLIQQVNDAMLDLMIHSNDAKKWSKDILKLENSLYSNGAKEIYATKFSHLFGGGYDAGYYGYLWSELIAADAFQLFVKRGIYSKEIALRLRTHILSKGGSVDPAKAYRKFRGSDPAPNSLLKKYQLE